MNNVLNSGKLQEVSVTKKGSLLSKRVRKWVN
jgi:hypothetical protein